MLLFSNRKIKYLKIWYSRTDYIFLFVLYLKYKGDKQLVVKHGGLSPFVYLGGKYV